MSHYQQMVVGLESSHQIWGITFRIGIAERALPGSLAALVDRFEANLIAHLRRTFVRRARGKFDGFSRSKHD